MTLTYKDFFDDNYTREEARATELAEQAAAAGKNYGFTSSPNPYSDLLTKTFEEMGYKVNWIFVEWNPKMI